MFVRVCVCVCVCVRSPLAQGTAVRTDLILLNTVWGWIQNIEVQCAQPSAWVPSHA